jgi:DNA-binding transcriptional LysR family regulator
MVELRHLRYFIAVAEELNFSRAAERMHMAQPPLSAAIRQLERDLGVDLFVRTTREVKLTDAGRAFLAGARRTLADADRAAQDAKRAAAGELGQLRIAYSWSTRFETLPALGRAFTAGHPDVELLAQEMWNARMPAAFASGSIDIALSLCPEIAAELELAPIRKERLVALLPEAHPLAPEDAIPLSALADHEFAGDRTAAARRIRSHLPPRRLRAATAPRVIPHRLGSRRPGRDPGRCHCPANCRRRAPRGHRGGLAQRTDRLARDLPRLAQRRQLARGRDVRGGRTLDFRPDARRVPIVPATAHAGLRAAAVPHALPRRRGQPRPRQAAPSRPRSGRVG